MKMYISVAEYLNCLSWSVWIWTSVGCSQLTVSTGRQSGGIEGVRSNEQSNGNVNSSCVLPSAWLWKQDALSSKDPYSRSSTTIKSQERTAANEPSTVELSTGNKYMLRAPQHFVPPSSVARDRKQEIPKSTQYERPSSGVPDVGKRLVERISVWDEATSSSKTSRAQMPHAPLQERTKGQSQSVQELHVDTLPKRQDWKVSENQQDEVFKLNLYKLSKKDEAAHGRDGPRRVSVLPIPIPPGAIEKKST